MILIFLSISFWSIKYRFIRKIENLWILFTKNKKILNNTIKSLFIYGRNGIFFIKKYFYFIFVFISEISKLVQVKKVIIKEFIGSKIYITRIFYKFSWKSFKIIIFQTVLTKLVYIFKCKLFFKYLNFYMYNINNNLY